LRIDGTASLSGQGRWLPQTHPRFGMAMSCRQDGSTRGAWMRSSPTPASVAVVRPATATTPPTMAETMAATMTMRRHTCPGSCAVAGVGSMSVFLRAPGNQDLPSAAG
jgi:hypothetical protein